MNYAQVKTYDIANGPGVRVSLFVSGCTLHCKGCFNKETWDPNYGCSFTSETANEIFHELEKPYITGLTILGGEPLDFDHPGYLEYLAHTSKYSFPEKNIWLYTGHTLEEILEKKDEQILLLLNDIDVLVDGPFVEELKDPSLKFRGSKNQRLIDLKYTLKKWKLTGVLDIKLLDDEAIPNIKDNLHARCACRMPTMCGKVVVGDSNKEESPKSESNEQSESDLEIPKNPFDKE